MALLEELWRAGRPPIVTTRAMPTNGVQGVYYDSGTESLFITAKASVYSLTLAPLPLPPTTFLPAVRLVDRIAAVAVGTACLMSLLSKLSWGWSPTSLDAPIRLA